MGSEKTTYQFLSRALQPKWSPFPKPPRIDLLRGLIEADSAVLSIIVLVSMDAGG